MRRFALEEVSGVDFPAVEYATVAIMKRAPDGAQEKKELENLSNGALAEKGLALAAELIRKTNPALSEAQAFSRAYQDPQNVSFVKAEREASAQRFIAGAPVARTAAHVLNDLSDDSIRAMVEEIHRENPFLDDVGIVRILTQRVEAPGYQADVAAARRAGDHAPGPSDPVSKRDAALGALNAKAEELRKADPSLTEAGAFAKAYANNPKLAADEREASRVAL